jgi:hypothetical protein
MAGRRRSANVAAMETRTLTIALELRLAGDEVSGVAAAGDRPSEPFQGWLGLIGVLDHLTRPTDPTAPKEPS